MTKALTKAELVAALAQEMGSDKKTANAALEALAKVVAREVAAGNTVTLPGIAKVVCRERPARTVRNPATGATIEKPADRAVKLTPVKALKEAVGV